MIKDLLAKNKIIESSSGGIDEKNQHSEGI